MEKSISKQIRLLRARTGLSQSQLGRLLDVSPSVISRFEDMNYRGHSLKTLSKIAKVLKAD